MSEPQGILSGMRVVEGSAFVAAPLGGMTLAQLGADVIRFDPIGGGLDRSRWPVNDEGQIVGSSETPGGGTHGFLWADGVMTDLGTLAGMTGSVAYDINEDGRIVGVSYDAGASRAFVWSAGVMQELPLPPGYCCS